MTQTTGQIFGQMVSGATVELAVIDTLKLWLPLYLRQMEVQTERENGSMPTPRRYTQDNFLDKWPDEELPCVVVVSPGLIGEPQREGRGTYRAKWLVGVGLIASANNKENTNVLVKDYGAVVRAVLLQKPSLGGIAEGVSWRDESYDDGPRDADRTLGVVQEIFTVEMRNVVDSFAGPSDPVIHPSPDDPGWSTPPTSYTVDDAAVIVEHKEDD